MPVPDYQTIMGPMLTVLRDGEERRLAWIRERIAERFSLSESDLAETTAGGRTGLLVSRVSWAATYLHRAGTIERPRRGVYHITDRGRTLSIEHPERVDDRVLAQFPEFRDFTGTSARREPGATGTAEDAAEPHAGIEATPIEQMELAHTRLRNALVADLLDRIAERPPAFFEQLVLDVLQAMGYGAGHDRAALRLGRSGDQGVDGVISEDELGLDLIYVQAKRWAAGTTVDRPEVQRFFGALHGQGATKGVLITTAAFSKGARDYAERTTPRVILVDGERLAGLMINHGVGVALAHAFEVRRIDLDCFVADADGR